VGHSPLTTTGLPLVAAVLVVAGCAAGGTPTALIEFDRTREVRFSGCSRVDELAVGIDIGDGLVLTVAHAVRGATAVTADGTPAEVVAIDHRVDAALVSVDERLSPLVLGPGEGSLRLVTADGARAVGVEREVTVRIEEPRDGTVYERDGLVLDVVVAAGESGAAVVDGDGVLTGMVFATSRTSERSYAVSATELRPFVDAFRADGERAPVDTGSC